jgi:hypothetical protein
MRADFRVQAALVARGLVLVDQALAREAVEHRCGLAQRGLGSGPSPASIATTTFLISVRILLRRLALCWRRFSAWRARFSACGELANSGLLVRWRL